MTNYYITISDGNRRLWKECPDTVTTLTQAKRHCSKEYGGLNGTLQVGKDYGCDFVEAIAERNTNDRSWKQVA